MSRFLGLGVVDRRRGRPTIRASSHGCLEPGDDLGNMCAIKLLDGSIELCTLLAFDKQLCDLCASLHILWLYFPNFSFLRPSLALRMRWPEGILRPLLPVFLQCLLRLRVPNLTFIMGHILPRETNDLRQRAVVGFDLSRDMLVFDEG